MRTSSRIAMATIGVVFVGAGCARSALPQARDTGTAPPVTPLAQERYYTHEASGLQFPLPKGLVAVDTTGFVEEGMMGELDLDIGEPAEGAERRVHIHVQFLKTSGTDAERIAALQTYSDEPGFDLTVSTVRGITVARFDTYSGFAFAGRDFGRGHHAIVLLPEFMVDFWNGPIGSGLAEIDEIMKGISKH